MAKDVTPSEISKFLNCVADGIDRSRSPKAPLVAADIKAAIAALEGNEDGVKRVKEVVAAVEAASTPPKDDAKPIKLSFSGELHPELLKRAGAEIAKRRPGLAGKKLRMSLVAEVAE